MPWDTTYTGRPRRRVSSDKVIQKKRSARSVTFSRYTLPSATPRDPGHRQSPAPQVSSIRGRTTMSRSTSQPRSPVYEPISPAYGDNFHTQEPWDLDNQFGSPVYNPDFHTDHDTDYQYRSPVYEDHFHNNHGPDYYHRSPVYQPNFLTDQPRESDHQDRSPFRQSQVPPRHIPASTAKEPRSPTHLLFHELQREDAPREGKFRENRSQIDHHYIMDVCYGIRKLQQSVDATAKQFNPALQDDSSALKRFLDDENHKETIAYMSLICRGGPDGETSWLTLIQDKDSLQYLVAGMIFHALKKHIFEAWPLHMNVPSTETSLLLKKAADRADPFVKQNMVTNHFRCNWDFHKRNPASIEQRQRQRVLLATRIFILVAPLLELHKSQSDRTTQQDRVQTLIERIIDAAIWNVERMALNLDTIFEWTNAFKDFEFDPKTSECINVASMLETSPYVKEVETAQAKLRKGEQARHQSIISMIVYPGLVCYRKGKVDADDNLLSDQGWTQQVLLKNVVVLTWGRQKLVTRYLGNREGYHAAVERGETDDASISLWELFVKHHQDKKASA